MTFRAQIIKETQQAKLVKYEGRDIWLPRSQISSFTELQKETPGNPKVAELTIPGWLASVKGIAG